MLVVVMGDAQHLTCVYAIETGNQMTVVRVSAHYHHIIIHSFIHSFINCSIFLLRMLSK